MDKKIIITGASGMIGAGVTRYLNDKGWTNLLLVDDLKKSEKWKNLVGKQFVDIISKHALFSWLQGKEKEVDAIIHLGACSDTVEQDADYDLKNLVGKQFVDIISKHALFSWLQGKEKEVDAIIHLGACSDTVEQDADYLLE